MPAIWKTRSSVFGFLYNACGQAELTNPDASSNEGEAKSIECMAADCNIIVDERTVALLIDHDTLDR